jgi:hypothetical protein
LLSSSSSPHSPRPGDALGMMIRRAPLSAATVGMIACHASSQISIAAVANGVSNTDSRRPRVRKRSSSNTP